MAVRLLLLPYFSQMEAPESTKNPEFTRSKVVDAEKTRQRKVVGSSASRMTRLMRDGGLNAFKTDRSAAHMLALVNCALGIARQTKAERLLNAMTDEQRAEVYERASKNLRVVMSGLYPQAVRILRTIMAEYEETGGKAKEAGAAAARVVEFMKAQAPVVVINNQNVMKVASSLELPAPEAAVLRVNVAHQAVLAGSRVIAPEEEARKFGAPLTRQVLAMPEPERVQAQKPVDKATAAKREEVTLEPVRRYREGE